MATGTPFFGKVRGKIGGVVLRIEHGKQIVSEYNPEKSGIVTDAQIKQRAKMTLANSVSRALPFECIAGFSPYPSRARRLLVGSLAKLATATMVSQTEARATLNARDIKLSDGVNVLTLRQTINTISVEGHRITISVTFPTDTDAKGFLGIVLFYNNTTQLYERAMYAVSGDINSGGTASAEFILSEGTLPQGLTAYGYAVPFVVNTLEKRCIYENLLMSETAGTFNASVAIAFARHDIFGGTIHVGSVVYP